MSRGTRLSVLGLYNYDSGLFDEMVFPSGFTEDEKQTVVGNILVECAELETLFPDPSAAKAVIGLWSKLNLSVWQRIFTASNLEYNPIENYNRTEIETVTDEHSDTHSGNDVNRSTGTDLRQLSSSNTQTHSGTDANSISSTVTETNSGTDTQTNKISGYDSGTLVDHDQGLTQHGHVVTTGTSGSNSTTHGHVIGDSGSGSDSMTYGKTDTLTHGEKIEHDGEVTKESHITGNIGVTTSQQMLEQEIEVSAKLNVMQMIVDSFKNRFCILVY